MRILILSFYYKPDLCAGSFRCTALVNELLKLGTCQVEVVTTLPNRYHSFTKEAPKFEKGTNLSVHRISLPRHQSGMADQVRSFYTFFRNARKITKNGQYDLVFATTSRLFTGFLGARIAREKRLPLYLDVRDIFVDSIHDVMPKGFGRFIGPILKGFERYTFDSADRINLVSKGFAGYFSERYKDKEYRWFSNGVDREFVGINPVSHKKVQEKSVIKILYAGNLGAGQGLEIIVPELAMLLRDKAHFHIIGDGGRSNLLREKAAKLENVVVSSPVSRDELISHYVNADVLFLHLNAYEAFKKVLPSKIFEYAALGKPILAGVAGYPKEFIESEVTNSAVFEPGNADSALKAFSRLEICHDSRDVFIRKFSRETLMAKMANDMVSLI